MSADIIERLRSSDGFKIIKAGDGGPAIVADTDLMNEAADTIERLEAAALTGTDAALHVYRAELQDAVAEIGLLRQFIDRGAS